MTTCVHVISVGAFPIIFLPTEIFSFGRFVWVASFLYSFFNFSTSPCVLRYIF